MDRCIGLIVEFDEVSHGVDIEPRLHVGGWDRHHHFRQLGDSVAVSTIHYPEDEDSAGRYFPWLREKISLNVFSVDVVVDFCQLDARCAASQIDPLVPGNIQSNDVKDAQSSHY
ncbi:hypothetical protein D3C87_1898530 [compost metagenome]